MKDNSLAGFILLCALTFIVGYIYGANPGQIGVIATQNYWITCHGKYNDLMVEYHDGKVSARAHGCKLKEWRK